MLLLRLEGFLLVVCLLSLVSHYVIDSVLFIRFYVMMQICVRFVSSSYNAIPLRNKKIFLEEPRQDWMERSHLKATS